LKSKKRKKKKRQYKWINVIEDVYSMNLVKKKQKRKEEKRLVYLKVIPGNLYRMKIFLFFGKLVSRSLSIPVNPKINSFRSFACIIT
jgi:hypothetical protein